MMLFVVDRSSRRNMFLKETRRKTNPEQVPGNCKAIIVLRATAMRNGPTAPAEEMRRQELLKQELNGTVRE